MTAGTCSEGRARGSWSHRRGTESPHDQLESETHSVKRILLGFATSVAVAAPLALVATPADAATNTPCMTRAEFTRVHTGMTVAQVKHIVGSAGSVSLFSPPMVIRNHRTCTAFHVATVSYWGGRVSSRLYI